MKQVTLEFHPASEPPDTNRDVFVTDGKEIAVGWFHYHREVWNYHDYNGVHIAHFDVLEWADFPCITKVKDCLE
jgi:hypothetical protein